MKVKIINWYVQPKIEEILADYGFKHDGIFELPLDYEILVRALFAEGLNIMLKHAQNNPYFDLIIFVSFDDFN